MNGEHKITSRHRERAALIYLRQSSMAQVREHTESTRRQYGLADKAVALGWAAHRRGGDRHRPGDLRQVGRGPGRVHRAGDPGLLAARSGRSSGSRSPGWPARNADVARLAEFARITGTLLIDADGVYDPADVNDRMLLGFKGTMGEVELHVMAQRLQANKRAAAERGELRTPLPVGLCPRRRRR